MLLALGPLCAIPMALSISKTQLEAPVAATVV